MAPTDTETRTSRLSAGPSIGDVPPGSAELQPSVPCVYCRCPIPGATFSFWSRAERLLSATCPTCERRVTLTTPTWRRWLGLPAASRQATATATGDAALDRGCIDDETSMVRPR
jgi:hypothetical protein